MDNSIFNFHDMHILTPAVVRWIFRNFLVIIVSFNMGKHN